MNVPSLLPAVKLHIKVRTNQMAKVLNNVTHPTDAGASKLQFVHVPDVPRVPASLLLLIDLLHDEHGADLTMPNMQMEEHLTRPPKARTKRVSQLTKAVDPSQDFIPPAPPAVVCEFDLGVWESANKVHGRAINVVLGFLVFQVEGEVRINCERGMHHGQEAGRDPEASGVWRAETRRQGNSSPTHHYRPAAGTRGK